MSKLDSTAERLITETVPQPNPPCPLDMVKKNQTDLDSLFFEGDDNHIRNSVSRQLDSKDRFKNPYISDNLRKPSTSKKSGNPSENPS
mmetsp:Transcript_35780/g.54819  ORF Transcript_35780/g.54819 Transcript_35780/m.54819 type:complete len:88 (+) Transcript_35780:1913-2176(+)